VLIDKKPASERPEWSPATLEEVTSEHFDRFFSKESEFMSSSPKLSIPEHLMQWKETPPSRFALPTERDVADVIRGSHSSSGQMAITRAELLSKFEKLRAGKHGLRAKIEEIVERKCVSVDGEWLQWQH
jgi:3-hydroxyisobutyryl-CoA hydrolase